jgi:peroxiredoxin family protein
MTNLFILPNSGYCSNMEPIKITAPMQNRQNETIEELNNKMIEGHVKIQNCVDYTIENSDTTSDDSEHMFGIMRER